MWMDRWIEEPQTFLLSRTLNSTSGLEMETIQAVNSVKTSQYSTVSVKWIERFLIILFYLNSNSQMLLACFKTAKEEEFR